MVARTDHVAGDVIAAAEWNGLAGEVNGIPAAVTAEVGAKQIVVPWQANLAYATGRSVLNPSGELVKAPAAVPARAVYTPADWTAPASATYLRAAGTGFVALGDSISSLAGGGGYGNSWPLMAPLLSSQRMLNLGNAGISGNNTAQILARVPDVIALKAQVATVMGGTNDLTQAVPLATIQSNLAATVVALRDAGILPVLCTISPRGNTTYLTNTLKLNRWIKKYAQQYKVPLIDFFDVLTDPLTGMFKAGYDLDGVHPAPPGHAAMAAHVNAVLVPLLPLWNPIRAVVATGDPDNKLSNPFMTAGSPTPTSFSPSGTAMTGYTEGLVIDSDFAGKAWEWNFTNPSDPLGYRALAQSMAAGWAVGDLLALSMRAKVISASGMVYGAGNGLVMSALAFNGNPTTTKLVDGDAVVHAAGLYWVLFTVPPGTTLVQLLVQQGKVPTTGQLTTRVGEFGIFNLTQLGLTSV